MGLGGHRRLGMALGRGLWRAGVEGAVLLAAVYLAKAAERSVLLADLAIRVLAASP